MPMQTEALSASSGESLLRLPEVRRLTGLSRSQLYTLVRRGEFPSQVKISERCSCWIESEVRGFIADRIAASRAARSAA